MKRCRPGIGMLHSVARKNPGRGRHREAANDLRGERITFFSPW
jgi:hypothetical protein